MKKLLAILALLAIVGCAGLQGKPWVVVVDGSYPDAKPPNVVFDGSVRK